MKLGLGTVQFGMNYGISNPTGQTTPKEAAHILETAWGRGIELIDTASCYGTSEQVIGMGIPPGARFRIVTKTPSFGGADVSSRQLDEVDRAFTASLRNLGCPSVYGLLAHNADDLLSGSGRELFRRMERLKQSGRVAKIGASIYMPQQVDAILHRFPIDLIQVPINVIDQRLIAGGQLAALKHHGVEIHGRSAFLQGLLLMAPETLPDHFASIRPLLGRYHEVIGAEGLTPLQAALACLSQIGSIDAVVCGVNTREQLMELCDAASSSTAIDFSQFAVTDESILNPGRWQL